MIRARSLITTNFRWVFLLSNWFCCQFWLNNFCREKAIFSSAFYFVVFLYDQNISKVKKVRDFVSANFLFFSHFSAGPAWNEIKIIVIQLNWENIFGFTVRVGRRASIVTGKNEKFRNSHCFNRREEPWNNSFARTSWNLQQLDLVQIRRP